MFLYEMVNTSADIIKNAITILQTIFFDEVFWLQQKEASAMRKNGFLPIHMLNCTST